MIIKTLFLKEYEPPFFFYQNVFFLCNQLFRDAFDY